MKKRKYTKTLRAEQQDETRKRIIDALIALHQEVGPANTTVKAVAEKAGVQRLTVYRHFPDETRMLQACTSHWLELNPPPAADEWAAISDPCERCHAALLAFYRYYHRTQSMWVSSYRDVANVEALHKPMEEFEAYLDAVRDELLKAWKTKAGTKNRIKAILRHGLRFSTWQSLNEELQNDEKIADLMSIWLESVSQSNT
jgi:AcrR family transcriptional regulator